MSEQKPGFVWFSFGSDKTGAGLAEILGYEGGKRTPDFSRFGIVVGWGCKPGTKYDPAKFAELVTSGQLRVLNHPDAVQRNRDKLSTLTTLSNRGIPVPGFVETPGKSSSTRRIRVRDGLKAGTLAFPLVGLNRFGKGEPQFCYTFDDVERATLPRSRDSETTPDYFRTLDQGGDEFRIHVFRDVVIGAEKKMLSKEPVAAISGTLLKRLERRWTKEGVKVDGSHKAMVQSVIQELGAEIMNNASHLRKSTSLGWELTPLGVTHVPDSLAGLAIEALDALELDVGAINISVVDSSYPRVLSVTTSPALTTDLLFTYAERIRSFGNCEDVPEKRRVEGKHTKASPELVARLAQKINCVTSEKAAEALKILEE